MLQMRVGLALALVVGACSDAGAPQPPPLGGVEGGAAGAAQGGAAGAAEGGAAGAGGSAGAGTLPGRVQRPNLIVSRSATAFSSPANGAAVIDGQYHNGGWSAGSPSDAAPSWVALRLAAGPTRLLLSWDDGGTYNYQDLPGTMVYGLPAAYHVDVSADSTDGVDGTWEAVATVADNSVRTRAHAFDFTGKSWVKLVITAPPPAAPNGVSIGEIDVHDISATGSGLPEDTWFFMGDSITAFAYDRAGVHQPSFAAGVNSAVSAFYPAMINGGIGGETSAGALLRLPDTLSRNPDYRFFILGYGTNDAANSQIPVAQFKANLQSMVDLVKAAGREPIIPHIPPSADGSHAAIPDYNTAIDELTAANDLVVGADLYAYFNSDTALFTCPPCGGTRMTDNLHPNDTGLAGMNRAWSEAMRALYP